jgi:hypothetical protein
MIRVLVMIAVTGFLVSVVTLSTAVALGGPDILTDNAWNGWGRWSWHDGGDWADRGRDSGPQATREIAWTGGDTLDVDVPAEITYTQAPGPGKLTVTGPQRALDNLVLDNGHLHYARGRRHRGELTVVMTAPGVSRFDLAGSAKLEIHDYKQDRLSLDLAGDGAVTATGETRMLALTIAGSGETDLSRLKVTDADVQIDGSGEATLAPTGAANVDIAGSGEVTLLTRPAKLESNVSGSGVLHQSQAATDAPALAPPPPATKPRRGRT